MAAAFRYAWIPALSVVLYVALNLHWMHYFAPASVPGATQGHIDIGVIPYDESIRTLDAAMFWRQMRFLFSYSPGYYLVSLAATFIFGKSLIALIFVTNLLFFVVGCAFLFLVARRCFGVEAGLMAVSIFPWIPLVFLSSRVYALEFGVMGMAPLALWSLLATDHFRRWRESLFFGAVCALASLMKDVAYFSGFAVIPALVHWYAGMRGPRGARMAATVNFFSALAVWAALLVPRYWEPTTLRLGVMFREPDYWGRSLPVMTSGFVTQQLSWLFFVLLVFGLFRLRRSWDDRASVLACWIAVPWLILTLMPHWKLYLYVLPYLPAVAIVAAAGLASIRNRRIKMALWAAVLCAGAAQALKMSYSEDRSVAILGRPYFHLPDLFTKVGSEKRWAAIPRQILGTIEERYPQGARVLFGMPTDRSLLLAGWLHKPHGVAMDFFDLQWPRCQSDDFRDLTLDEQLALCDVLILPDRPAASIYENILWESADPVKDCIREMIYGKAKDTLSSFRQLATFSDPEWAPFNVRVYVKRNSQPL